MSYVFFLLFHKKKIKILVYHSPITYITAYNFPSVNFFFLLLPFFYSNIWLHIAIASHHLVLTLIKIYFTGLASARYFFSFFSILSVTIATSTKLICYFRFPQYNILDRTKVKKKKTFSLRPCIHFRRLFLYGTG